MYSLSIEGSTDILVFGPGRVNPSLGGLYLKCTKKAVDLISFCLQLLTLE